MSICGQSNAKIFQCLLPVSKGMLKSTHFAHKLATLIGDVVRQCEFLQLYLISRDNSGVVLIVVNNCTIARYININN